MRVALTDQQVQQLHAAAALLRTESRDVFVSDVMLVLETRCRCRAPSDRDVAAAINDTIGVVPVFMCDDATNKQEVNKMSRTFRRRTIDDEESDEVLRDQEVLHVPMYAMDGVRFHDGRGNAVGHRPGFIVDAAAGRAARRAIEDAHADYEKSQAEAWKGPPTGAGSQEPRETRSVGDRCLVQGRDGHLYEADDGSLVCVPDEWGDAALSEAAIEHARYLDHLTSAWKGGKP